MVTVDAIASTSPRTRRESDNHKRQLRCLCVRSPNTHDTTTTECTNAHNNNVVSTSCCASRISTTNAVLKGQTLCLCIIACFNSCDHDAQICYHSKE
jgi:hypothetical protein